MVAAPSFLLQLQLIVAREADKVAIRPTPQLQFHPPQTSQDRTSPSLQQRPQLQFHLPRSRDRSPQQFRFHLPRSSRDRSPLSPHHVTHHQAQSLPLQDASLFFSSWP